MDREHLTSIVNRTFLKLKKDQKCSKKKGIAISLGKMLYSLVIQLV